MTGDSRNLGAGFMRAKPCEPRAIRRRLPSDLPLRGERGEGEVWRGGRAVNLSRHLSRVHASPCEN